MTPYKGRVIDKTKPVKVYKNLHKDMYSIQQDNVVVAHAETVFLQDVTFEVSQAGRERVIREGRKNVHAKVVGMLTAPFSGKDKVSYNPKQRPHFYCGDQYIFACERIALTKTGVFI